MKSTRASLLICGMCLALGIIPVYLSQKSPRVLFTNRRQDFKNASMHCPNATNVPFHFDATVPLNFKRQEHPSDAKIPSIVHFVFNPGESYQPFGLIQYLSIASALNVLKPMRVLVHYRTQPSGFYWDMIKAHVELIRVREVNLIFDRPVRHYAHKADVIRLESLMEHGGIYLDLDVVVLRPFTSLLIHEFVMGQEGENARYGLCNAVILANKDSHFLRRWYESYRSFNDSCWSCHSVQMPRALSQSHPSEIHVVGHKTFFWPLWDGMGRQEIFSKFDYDYSSNLAVHVWNSAARKELDGFSQLWLLQCRSAFLSMMRAYVPRPLISIIITCAHHANVRDSVDSLIRQSWPFWELVVVDDFMPGRCGKDLLNLAADLKSVTILTHIHPQQSRNVGVQHARGMWVSVLNPETTIGPNFMRDAELLMTQDPRLGLITSDMPVSGASSFLDASPAKHSNLIALYRRSLWDQIGGYNTSLQGQDQDEDFLTRVSDVGYPTKSIT